MTELTKEQMQQIIDVLQSKVDAIEDKEKWQPKGGNYYVDCDGAVVHCKSVKAIRRFGVEFETEAAAEKAAKAYRLYHRLYKLAEELNPPDWQPDFISGDNYIILYGHDVNKYFVQSRGSKQSRGFKDICGVYFSSEEIAKEAVKILEQEDK